MVAAGTLGAGVNNGGVITKTPAASGRMVSGATLKLRGLQMQRRWGETPHGYFSAWDWAGWIKPQIDLAVSAGATALKWFIATQSVLSASISRATFHARIDQFLDYTDSLGLYVYMTLNSGFGESLGAAMQDEAALAVAHMSSRTKIVGYDMGNEITTSSGGIEPSVAYLAALRPKLLSVTSVPLSCGLSCGNINQAFADDHGGRSIAPYCDFMDFHPYWGAGNLTPQNVTDWWNIQALYKPWVIGECGREANGTAPTRGERWASLKLLADMPDCFGAFGYTTVDFEPAPASYGMWRTDLTTGPDSAAATPFATWPAHT